MHINRQIWHHWILYHNFYVDMYSMLSVICLAMLYDLWFFVFFAYLFNTILVVCFHQGLEPPVLRNTLHIKMKVELRHNLSLLIFCFALPQD